MLVLRGDNHANACRGVLWSTAESLLSLRCPPHVAVWSVLETTWALKRVEKTLLTRPCLPRRPPVPYFTVYGFTPNRVLYTAQHPLTTPGGQGSQVCRRHRGRLLEVQLEATAGGRFEGLLGVVAPAEVVAPQPATGRCKREGASAHATHPWAKEGVAAVYAG